MDELEVVYDFSKRINRLEQKLKGLIFENTQGNSDVNRRTVARINKIEASIRKLKDSRLAKLSRVYSGYDNRPKTAPTIGEMHVKICKIDIGDNITTLKMTPNWFKPDDKKGALKDIIYPTDGTDRNLINTVARYRTIINKSKDFCLVPLEVNESSTETLIIALDAFARQYGGELTFTSNNLSFFDSIEHTACGVANLGSVHLIAADYIPTAKFSFKVNLDYDRDLAQSTGNMKTFARDFLMATARLLRCTNDYVRIFSIEKIENRRGIVLINFGLTTPDQNQTESLARHFQTLVRRSDFRNDKILRYIESARYRYELIPVLSYLQLSPKDFDPQYNFDFRQTNLSEEDRRGNCPYYPPLGWYRHALNVTNKYPDNTWITSGNTDGEWSVAFHGTHSKVVDDSTRQELLPSSAAADSIQKRGSTVHQPRLYVTTHCNGGADLYTQPFTIPNKDKDEIFTIVFQCRVKPNSFTARTDPVNVGQAWRIIDPEAVRPYGLLLKKETA